MPNRVTISASSMRHCECFLLCKPSRSGLLKTRLSRYPTSLEKRPRYPCRKDRTFRYIPLACITTVRVGTLGYVWRLSSKFPPARYWKNPHKFDPSRFLGDWNRDAFIPFSAGPRACLGRRFNETESVAVLTMIALNYKIGILEEPQFAHETPRQRSERILRSKPAITMT